MPDVNRHSETDRQLLAWCDLRHQHAEHKARSCLARALGLGWQDFKGRNRGSSPIPGKSQGSERRHRKYQEMIPRSTKTSMFIHFPKFWGMLMTSKEKSLEKYHQFSPLCPWGATVWCSKLTLPVEPSCWSWGPLRDLGVSSDALGCGTVELPSGKHRKSYWKWLFIIIYSWFTS